MKKLYHGNLKVCKPKNLPTINDNSLAPSIKWYENSHFCLVFKGSCLKKMQLILIQIE